MNDRKIELSDELCLVSYTSREIHKNFIFTLNKTIIVRFMTAQTFLTRELSQYCKCGNTSLHSEQIAARSECHRFGNTVCLCLPIWPAKAVAERGPKRQAKVLANDFAVNAFHCFLVPTTALGWPDDRQGLKLGPILERVA